MALPHTCNAITAPRLYRYRTAVTLFPACGNTRLSEVCSWKNSHRIHSKFLVEKTSTDFTLSLQLKKLPQISQILTDVRARILPTESTLSLQLKKLPQISQILTDVRACISPTESTYFTEFFSARKFCVNLWNLWENISAEKDLFSHALVLAILL